MERIFSSPCWESNDHFTVTESTHRFHIGQNIGDTQMSALGGQIAHLQILGVLPPGFCKASPISCENKKNTAFGLNKYLLNIYSEENNHLGHDVGRTNK